MCCIGHGGPSGMDGAGSDAQERAGPYPTQTSSRVLRGRRPLFSGPSAWTPGMIVSTVPASELPVEGAATGSAPSPPGADVGPSVGRAAPDGSGGVLAAMAARTAAPACRSSLDVWDRPFPPGCGEEPVR